MLDRCLVIGGLGPSLQGSGHGRNQVGQQDHGGAQHTRPTGALRHSLNQAHDPDQASQSPCQRYQREPGEGADDPADDDDDRPPRDLRHGHRDLGSGSGEVVVALGVGSNRGGFLRTHLTAVERLDQVRGNHGATAHLRDRSWRRPPAHQHLGILHQPRHDGQHLQLARCRRPRPHEQSHGRALEDTGSQQHRRPEQRQQCQRTQPRRQQRRAHQSEQHTGQQGHRVDRHLQRPRRNSHRPLLPVAPGCEGIAVSVARSSTATVPRTATSLLLSNDSTGVIHRLRGAGEMTATDMAV